MHDLKNVHQILVRLPLPLPGRIPENRGLGNGRGGTTQLEQLNWEKGVMPEAHPPTNPSVCFPSPSYVMLFLFSILCLMTTELYLPYLAQEQSVCRAPGEKGALLAACSRCYDPTAETTLHHLLLSQARRT